MEFGAEDPTCMHRAEHACNELVDAIALLHKRYQGRYPALIVPTAPEMREDKLLELLDFVLQGHQIGYSLVSFVWVIDPLQTYVFLVLECAVEVWMLRMERQLGQQEVNIFFDQRPITSQSLPSHSSIQAVNPAPICHCFPQGRRMAFLQDLVDCDQGLERLYFVCEDGLSIKECLSASSLLPACPVWPDWTLK